MVVTSDPGLDMEIFQRWINTGLLTGILGAIVYIGKPAIDAYIANRRLSMERATAESNRRIEEEKADRDGWQGLIKNLQSEVDRLTQRDKECEKRIATLNRRLGDADEALFGLARQFAQFQQAVGEAIPPENRSDVISEMMKRRAQYVTDGSAEEELPR